MTDHSSIVRLLHDSKKYDDQRLECPWCHRMDFTTGEFPGGIVFNCYHDSCRATHPSSGIIKARGAGPVAQTIATKTSKLRPYYKPTRALTAPEAAYLMHNYYLQAADIIDAGIQWGIEDRRYIFPIRNPSGVTRGHIARAFDRGKVSGKAITYKAADGAWCHWAVGAFPIVLVEDFLSALRVKRAGYTAVALLGTNLSNAVLGEIAKANAKHIIVALDNDATRKAFEIAWQLRPITNRARVAVLEADLKDLPTDSAVKEVLGL